MRKDSIAELSSALNKSSFTVAITGAGISIAAGGVTYAGMHSRSNFNMRDMRDPEKMYAMFYRTFLNSMFEHGPTAAHKALASLEIAGKMHGIITTNVDCMHTMAGSQNVAEIQGSFQINVCSGCGRYVEGYEIWNQGKMPVCEHCGNILLPYNIYSHAGLWDRDLHRAQTWMEQAELILIIGANGSYTHMYWNHKRSGAKIFQINPERTYFDRVSNLNIRQEADPVFEALMKLE